jgi:hypothetical protein
MACFCAAKDSVAGTAFEAWMMEQRTIRGMGVAPSEKRVKPRL